MQKQLSHSEVKFEKQQFPISLLLDNVEDGRNVGSFFRLADALGVKHLYLCGTTPVPPNKRVRKTARSTELYVPYSYHSSGAELVAELKQEGVTVGALEITDKSRALNDHDFSGYSDFVLVAGGEEKGISDSLLEEIDFAIHIPMRGVNSSMNVAMATAIALQEITRQKNRR